VTISYQCTDSTVRGQ